METATQVEIKAVQGPSAIVFPLVFSASNVSRLPGRRSFHRCLQKDSQGLPNAQMQLYNDLLTNRSLLWIGTPPQKFALIVDSRSTVTYVPCSGCDQCGNHQLSVLGIELITVVFIEIFR